jgi:hypothetical protein
MHLFSRTLVLDAVTPENIGVAADVREYVSGALGVELGLWAASFGAPYGSMTFAGPADGLAGVAAMNAQLADDTTYHAKAAALRAIATGPAESQLMNPLYGEVRGDGSPPIGAIATATTAIADGPFDQVVAFGIELAQIAEAAIGMPVIFGAGVAGTFGEFGWLSVAPDAAAADAANEALTSNADYVAKISASTGMFVSGGAHRVVSTRVA